MFTYKATDDATDKEASAATKSGLPQAMDLYHATPRSILITKNYRSDANRDNIAKILAKESVLGGVVFRPSGSQPGYTTISFINGNQISNNPIPNTLLNDKDSVFRYHRLHLPTEIIVLTQEYIQNKNTDRFDKFLAEGLDEIINKVVEENNRKASEKAEVYRMPEYK